MAFSPGLGCKFLPTVLAAERLCPSRIGPPNPELDTSVSVAAAACASERPLGGQTNAISLICLPTEKETERNCERKGPPLSRSPVAWAVVALAAPFYLTALCFRLSKVAKTLDLLRPELSRRSRLSAKMAVAKEAVEGTLWLWDSLGPVGCNRQNSCDASLGC